MQHHHQMPFIAVRHRIDLRRQRGLTLIEWMISITIGLILLIALTALIAQQSRTQAELEKSSRQIENGRYAMQLLQEEIQHAGYYGVYSDAGGMALPAAMPNPCSVDAAEMTAALPFHVQGFDAPAGIPSVFDGCPPSFNAANHVPGTDILVIRRVDSSVISGTGTLVIGETYLQSGKDTATGNLAAVVSVAASTEVNTTTFKLQKYNLATAAKTDLTTADLNKYLVQIYYLSPCSVPAGTNCSASNTDDGGVSVPTLKRIELTMAGGSPVFVTTALVEGIENMQIDYGFDSDGDGAPDGAFLKDAAAVQKWADVMAIRLHLLARNNERSGGHQDVKAYQMGLHDPIAPANDSFKRRVFSQLIRLVNPSSRRDS